MRDLIIFDCDGTLVDTVTDVARCFNMALATCGFSQHPIEEYSKFVGGDLETVVSKLLPSDSNSSDNINRVKCVYRHIYAEDSKPNTVPFDGMADLLRRLKLHNILLAVNSNKAQVLTEDVIHKNFPKNLFDSIVAYDEHRPSKPDSYGVKMICSQCGRKLDSAIYVGDGRSDILTAKHAGIPCVFVTWGQGNSDDCKDYKNSLIVNSTLELERVLMRFCEIR